LPGKSNSAPRIQKITRDVYGIISDEEASVESGFGANQGFVVLDDSVLLFDTGFSSAESLDRAISLVTDKKVRYIVNSHDHSDHVFGNSHFSKKYSKIGLKIIAHENCARNILRFAPQRLEYYKGRNKKLASMLSRVEIVPPNITYPEVGMRLRIEGVEFVFVHPENGAHTLGDTMLAIPEKGAMFLGDVFSNYYFPNVEDANIESWVNVLEDIDHTTYSKFLPGHGKLGDNEQLIAFSNYMRTLCEQLLSIGTDPDREKLRSCFETDGTHNWKGRFLVENNIDALLGNFPAKILPQKI
jgi:cyclase